MRKYLCFATTCTNYEDSGRWIEIENTKNIDKFMEVNWLLIKVKEKGNANVE